MAPATDIKKLPPSISATPEPYPALRGDSRLLMSSPQGPSGANDKALLNRITPEQKEKKGKEKEA